MGLERGDGWVSRPPVGGMLCKKSYAFEVFIIFFSSEILIRTILVRYRINNYSFSSTSEAQRWIFVTLFVSFLQLIVNQFPCKQLMHLMGRISLTQQSGLALGDEKCFAHPYELVFSFSSYKEICEGWNCSQITHGVLPLVGQVWSPPSFARPWIFLLDMFCLVIFIIGFVLVKLC